MSDKDIGKVDNEIFIVGTGRSGTSLLQSMLNAHREIAFVPETQFLRNYVFNAGPEGSIPDLEAFRATLIDDQKFNRARIAADDVVKGVKTYFESYKTFCALYLQRQGKKYIGDKDPRNIDFLTDLKTSFPNAKVIHIMRDPRDVVLSRTKAEWSKNAPFIVHPLIYNAQVRRGRKLGPQIFGKNYFEIQYEKLLVSPEEELTRLCEFLEVPYDAGMLSFGEKAKALVSKEELQWKKETLGPLLKNNTDKAIKELSTAKLMSIEIICAHFFKKGYYQASGKGGALARAIKSLIFIPLSLTFRLVYPLRLKLLK